MHMQKIRDGPGRSRELWPNVRYADTLCTGSRDHYEVLTLVNIVINTMPYLIRPIISGTGKNPYSIDPNTFGMCKAQFYTLTRLQ